MDRGQKGLVKGITGSNMHSSRVVKQIYEYVLRYIGGLWLSGLMHWGSSHDGFSACDLKQDTYM